MKIQEFFCDKNDGTYLVMLSSKDTKRTDLKVECTYRALESKGYEVKLFIGVQAYELMSEYSEKTIVCNYNRLKDNVKIYILNEINKDTEDKLNNSINEKVIPKPVYSFEPIGKVYSLSSPLGKKYRAVILAELVELKEMNDSKITILEGEYTIDKVMDYIKKMESTATGNRASIIS
ncbi:MAG: hypothetical protein NC548_45035 [Lachnospiraceae bacterium]|nr:hypothetical protein [Lachnospiraceae bacterium]